MIWQAFCCLVYSILVVFFASTNCVCAQKTVDERIEKQLSRSGQNRQELERALDTITSERREDMRFLIAHMPESDLQQLSADFLMQHISNTQAAFVAAPWSNRVSRDLYLNFVLPYANVTESREDWQTELREICLPMIEGIESPSLAAARINQGLFSKVGVKYSTKRKRADQSPSESIESGLASCTGLSILLINACRSVGIPARFVGTPSWSDDSGNHSWVEIWDDGWKFTGAAEPTGDKLNEGWFVERARRAKSGDPKYGIFAVSYSSTPVKFPLVWRSENEGFFAVDVTANYLSSAAVESETRTVRFQLLESKGNNRCVANLIVRDENGKVVFRGQTNDDSFDANDHISAELSAGVYTATAVQGDDENSWMSVTKKFKVDSKEKLITLRANNTLAELREELKSESFATVEQLLNSSFASAPLTAVEAKRATELIIATMTPILKAQREGEHKNKRISIGQHEMRYDARVFGEPPSSGHALVISMHGGGGAPAAVNDEQWKNQIRLYDLEEAICVAPRAPTNTWDLWHQSHVDALFARLIENMVMFEGVDPNRVYLTGYSAGGDGTYQLAPRIADLFAGAAMMAGHPNETIPDGLRNIPFALHMGGNDSAYDRNKIANDWKALLEQLKNDDPGGYEHQVVIHEGMGHWMGGKDIEGVEWMMQFSRRTRPERVVWVQDDVTHGRLYWLATDKDSVKAGDKIAVSREGNSFLVEESSVAEFQLLLDDRMTDFEKPVVVRYRDETIFSDRVNRTVGSIAKSLLERWDSEMVFPARITVRLDPSKK